MHNFKFYNLQFKQMQFINCINKRYRLAEKCGLSCRLDVLKPHDVSIDVLSDCFKRSSKLTRYDCLKCLRKPLLTTTIIVLSLKIINTSGKTVPGRCVYMSVLKARALWRIFCDRRRRGNSNSRRRILTELIFIFPLVHSFYAHHQIM